VIVSGIFKDQATGQSWSWSGQITEAQRTSKSQPLINDLCKSLSGKSIVVDANGYQGIIGPSGISLADDSKGGFSFTTIAAFTNEPNDGVFGQCIGGSLMFWRTRANVFVQKYTGTLSQNSNGAVIVSGTFVDQATGQSWSWSGQIK
jgi:hypothetical protein